MDTIKITATEIQPLDMIGDRRVQLAYTSGRRTPTTRVHFYGNASPKSFAPNQTVEVTRHTHPA